jgi:hypothetical protein
VIDSGILTAAKARELAAQFDAVNAADLTRGIIVSQTIHFAAAETADTGATFREQNQMRQYTRYASIFASGTTPSPRRR